MIERFTKFLIILIALPFVAILIPFIIAFMYPIALIVVLVKPEIVKIGERKK